MGSVRTQTISWHRVKLLLFFPSMKREREAEIYELFLLCSIHIQKTSKENRAWLCNLLLLSVQMEL